MSEAARHYEDQAVDKKVASLESMLNIDLEKILPKKETEEFRDLEKHFANPESTKVVNMDKFRRYQELRFKILSQLNKQEIK
ncbi:MAG: hypothetical protein WC480_04365 [Patescibacteria group bacterium]